MHSSYFQIKVMKVMVWYVISDIHKVMTILTTIVFVLVLLVKSPFKYWNIVAYLHKFVAVWMSIILNFSISSASWCYWLLSYWVWLSIPLMFNFLCILCKMYIFPELRLPRCTVKPHNFLLILCWQFLGQMSWSLLLALIGFWVFDIFAGQGEDSSSKKKWGEDHHLPSC
jgi:hypothetical protein